MHHTLNHMVYVLWRPSEQLHKDLVLRWNLTKASHKSEQPRKTKVNNHENANGGKKSKSRGGKEQRQPSAHLGQNKGNKEGWRCWKTYRQLVNGSNIAAPNNYGSSIKPKKATTKPRPINRQTLHSKLFQQSRGRVHSAYLLLQQECRIIKIIGCYSDQVKTCLCIKEINNILGYMSVMKIKTILSHHTNSAILSHDVMFPFSAFFPIVVWTSLVWKPLR